MITQCAEPAGFGHIIGLLGRAEHNHGELPEFGPVLKPAKDIKPGQPRHFEVEQEQIREWVLGAIGVRHLATEVIDRLLTICHVSQVMVQPGVLQGDAKEDEICLFVICKQDRPIASHTSFQGFSVFAFRGAGLILPSWYKGVQLNLFRTPNSLLSNPQHPP